MYVILYKGELLPRKNINDLKKWLKQFWAVQREWGVTAVEIYSPLYSQRGAFYIRYKVTKIDKWNKGMLSSEGEILWTNLGKITDINNATMEILVSVPFIPTL